MSRPWIPGKWAKPMSDYLESAGRNGPVLAGNTTSAQEQQARREMAALMGREFLP